MLKQIHVFVIGDVIGVGFRAWTKIQAKVNNVKGWVRNNYERPDVFGKSGGVEAVLQGEEDHLNKILEKLKEGSAISLVEEIKVFPEEPKEIFESFEIRK